MTTQALISCINFPQTVVSLRKSQKSLSIEIKTERLTIRSYVISDLENSVTLYSNPYLIKYFDSGKIRSREEVEQLVNDGCKYFNRYEPLGLFSIFTNDTEDFVGHFDLLPSTEPGAVEIGFILLKKYHNRGFCTEVINAFLFDYIPELISQGYKCEGFSIHTVIATAHPKNIASIKVIKKAGMHYTKSQMRFGNPRHWYQFALTTKVENL